MTPSPYMYFLEFGDFQIAGASPEPLVKVIGAGGAIVSGSDPEAEHDEMLLKARAVLEVVGGTLAKQPAASGRERAAPLAS